MAPTALISWAHDSDAGAERTDPIERDDADRAWQQTVLDFTNALRVQGNVKADIDIAHTSEPIDWARWGSQQVAGSDFVIVVVNKAWTRRFTGDEAPTRGAGAVAEANTLLGIFQRDRSEFDRKVIPVLLPGTTKADLPLQLGATTTWIPIPDFTPAGIEPLLRRIYNRPKHVLRPLRGSTPPLPPAEPPVAPDSPRPPADGRDDPAAPRPLADVSDADLADRLAVADSGLRSLPPEAANDNPTLPWARAWNTLRAEHHAILEELARRERTSQEQHDEFTRQRRASLANHPEHLTQEAVDSSERSTSAQWAAEQTSKTTWILRNLGTSQATNVTIDRDALGGARIDLAPTLPADIDAGGSLRIRGTAALGAPIADEVIVRWGDDQQATVALPRWQ